MECGSEWVVEWRGEWVVVGGEWRVEGWSEGGKEVRGERVEEKK